MKTIWTAGLALWLCAGFPLVAVSADPKDAGKSSAPAESRPQGMPFYGKVAAVDKTARLLTLEGKEKSRLFYLTASTRIHNAKRPATINDIVVGRWVGGFVRPDTNGRPEVVTLNLGVVQRGSTNTPPAARTK